MTRSDSNRVKGGNNLARASPATQTSRQISLKSAGPTSAKSAYISRPQNNASPKIFSEKLDYQHLRNRGDSSATHENIVSSMVVVRRDSHRTGLGSLLVPFAGSEDSRLPTGSRSHQCVGSFERTDHERS